MNNVSLIGRLVRDPETMEVSTGVKKATFTLAIDRDFAADKTDFIQCVAWRHQAEFIGNYIKKGGLISVQGRIETGSYEKDGKTVYTTNVIAERVTGLQGKSDANNAAGNKTTEAKKTETTKAKTNTQDTPWDLDL